MNARIAAATDYEEADPFLLDYFDFDEALLEHFNRPNVFEMCNLLRNQKSLDTQQNMLGEKLLSTCKCNNLIILNGRSGKDADIEKFTFRNCSVIDYAIVTAESAKYVQNFEIIDLDPIFSDGHSLLHFQISGRHTMSVQNKRQNKTIHAKMWDENKISDFCENLDQSKISDLMIDVQSKLNDVESVVKNDKNDFIT